MSKSRFACWQPYGRRELRANDGNGFAPSPADLPNYVNEMADISRPDLLYRRPTNGPQPAHVWQTEGAQQEHLLHAQNFINGLPRNTHYCALSALGHQPVWDCLNAECRTVNVTSLRSCPKCHTARGPAPLRLSRKPEPFRVRDPLFWIFREAGVM